MPQDPPPPRSSYPSIGHGPEPTGWTELTDWSDATGWPGAGAPPATTSGPGAAVDPTRVRLPWPAALLRPWLDPRPGELRGAVVVLALALALSLAFWFDAARRPAVFEPAPLVPVVAADEYWVTATDGSASAGVGTAGRATGGGSAAGRVVVHVSGAVAAPGLQELAAGARVGDAVVAAGGALPDARLERVNLARVLTDGEQIHVPRVGEDAPPPGVAASQGILPDGRIDLNRATAAELETLPGVGPARAAAIIAAREERPFTVPGDLRRVSGIGEATFQRLAPLIAVP